MISVFFTDYCSPMENSQLLSLIELMPDYIKYKIFNYRKWQDAHGCLLGKCLLMHILALKKETYTLSDLQYTKFGRPYINNLKYFDFNISHSGNMVVCAITDNGRIGIDIEERKSINLIDFKEQFSNKEWMHINNEKYPHHTFYDFWTKKEAILKAEGRGILLPLHQVDTTELEGIIIDNQLWFFYKIDIFKNYACNLAYNAIQDKIHLFYVDFKTNPRSTKLVFSLKICHQ